MGKVLPLVTAFLLCLPAFAVSPTKFVRVCVGMPSGDSAFGRTGQDELVTLLVAGKKGRNIIPIKLQAQSGAEAFDEARPYGCRYLVLFAINLVEISTWRRLDETIRNYTDAMYFRIEVAFTLYRLDGSGRIDSGSLVVDGLRRVEDVVSLATDHLSSRITRDLNK